MSSGLTDDENDDEDEYDYEMDAQQPLTTDGFLGIRRRWLGAVLWLALLDAFARFCIWTWPHQPAYLVFLSVLTSGVFALTFWRPWWGLFAFVVVVPGITTSSLTVFNYIDPARQLGVFGPAALMPAYGFILGGWLRALVLKDDAAPNRLRPLLLLFCALTVLSAVATAWRYADFWPVRNAPYLEQVVNGEGMTAGKAYVEIARTLANYLAGPLLLIGVCQAAYTWRRRTGREDAWPRWLGLYVLLPLLVGGVAPIGVGLYQVKDVWFGAHKFYVWPWMSRINATFFDPNALGSFIVLFVPWVLAVALLLVSVRWWLAPSVAVCGGVLSYAAYQLAMNSGSRTAAAGVAVMMMIALFVSLLLGLLRLARGWPRVLRGTATAVLCAGYAAVMLWGFYVAAPRGVAWVKRQPRIVGTSLARRLDQIPVGSVRRLARQVMTSRGPYAQLAVLMMRQTPMTGIGLGAFVIEFPNWKKLSREVIYVPDTACNYYLQIGAEQGIVALAVMLAIFAAWWLCWWRLLRARRHTGWWVFIGAGMASMLIVFLFGMHTRADEIQCLFWLFASQPFAAEALRARPAAGPPRRGMRYAWLPAAIVAGLYIEAAATRLSLADQRARFGWYKTEGFHEWERWGEPGGVRVRYTMSTATDTIMCEGIVFRQPWACLHPDVTAAPVRVTFELGGVSTSVIARTSEWQTMDLAVPASAAGSPLAYRIAASRVWSPRQYGLGDDLRELGVLLREGTWESDHGLYAEERWAKDESVMSERSYRWAGRDARMLIRAQEPYVRLPVLVSTPDVTSAPVTITISVNGAEVARPSWSSPGWQVVTVFLRGAGDAAQCALSLAASRTWQPSRHGLDDTRELGFAIGTPEPVPFEGFSHSETWQDQFSYRWAGREGRWCEQADADGRLVVTYLVGHPDAAGRPVTWSLDVNGVPAVVEHVTNGAWRAAVVPLRPREWADLHATVDRTWRPSEAGMGDTRELGFAVRMQ